MFRQIAQAIHALKVEQADRRAASDRLRKVARTEMQRMGVAEFARRIGTDPSSLQKAIKGERKFGLELAQLLQRYSRLDSSSLGFTDTD
jgi:hypothetical protein